jgi:hypothetical protein
MRLSDAQVRWGKTKLLYLNHRLPPWLTEDATPAIARTDLLATCADRRSTKLLNH